MATNKKCDECSFWYKKESEATFVFSFNCGDPDCCADFGYICTPCAIDMAEDMPDILDYYMFMHRETDEWMTGPELTERKEEWM